MKSLILLLLYFLLVACENKIPLNTKRSTNSQYSVDLLFEHEGCKVYGFRDSYRYHYFTNCTETITTHSEPCGKGCTKHYDENIRGRK